MMVMWVQRDLYEVRGVGSSETISFVTHDFGHSRHDDDDDGDDLLYCSCWLSGWYCKLCFQLHFESTKREEKRSRVERGKINSKKMATFASISSRTWTKIAVCTECTTHKYIGKLQNLLKCLKLACCCIYRRLTQLLPPIWKSAYYFAYCHFSNR